MKILSTKTVFTSKYFKVIQKVIERHGKTFTKDLIEKNSTVFVIPYTENEIYIESQYRDAYEKELIEVVAGKIESGKDPLETAKRELLEEAGLIANKWTKIAEWDMSANILEKIYVYAVTDLEEKKQHLDVDEEIKIMRLPFEEVLDKINNGEITIASNIAALFLFDKLKGEGKL
jgi:ADP-ribose pyrophosphatase